MKYIFNFSILIALSLTFNLAQASSCHVYISANQPCVNGPIPQKTLFTDSDGLAKISPKRCFNRALEYHRYCGYNGDDFVYTYYYNGTNWSGAVGNNGASNVDYMYVVNDIGQWINLGKRVD